MPARDLPLHKQFQIKQMQDVIDNVQNISEIKALAKDLIEQIAVAQYMCQQEMLKNFLKDK